MKLMGADVGIEQKRCVVVDAGECSLTPSGVRLALNLVRTALRTNSLPSDMSIETTRGLEAAWENCGVLVVERAFSQRDVLELPVTLGGFPVYTSLDAPRGEMAFVHRREVIAKIVNLSEPAGYEQVGFAPVDPSR